MACMHRNFPTNTSANHGFELFPHLNMVFIQMFIVRDFQHSRCVLQLKVNHFILKAGIAFNETNIRMENLSLFEITDYYLITHLYVQRALKKQDYMTIPIRVTYDYLQKSDFDIGVMLGVNMRYLAREELFFLLGVIIIMV